MLFFIRDMEIDDNSHWSIQDFPGANSNSRVANHVFFYIRLKKLDQGGDAPPCPLLDLPMIVNMLFSFRAIFLKYLGPSMLFLYRHACGQVLNFKNMLIWSLVRLSAPSSPFSQNGNLLCPSFPRCDPRNTVQGDVCEVIKVTSTQNWMCKL